MELGLFFPEIVMEGLKHGLFSLSLHRELLVDLQGVNHLGGLFFILKVGILVLLWRAVAGLHYEHHRGER